MSINLNGHEKPVNRMAAFSFARGDGYEHRDNPRIKKWHIAPKTVKFTGQKNDDLKGLKYSRLTVIGFLGKTSKKKPGLWLVKCCCGVYETRRSNTIKKRKDSQTHRCSICDQFATRKRHQEYTRLGYNLYDTLDNY
ncbi:unnamed protein product [marine sediment metagenome]|uniref:Uncharacterized protein n=1 Tax=marine sediment metagenome TaxID=412755 RepID=X1UR33_9ZZZZ